eukprot:361172-Chlamydomonas_euryale.AAC.7
MASPPAAARQLRSPTATRGQHPLLPRRRHPQLPPARRARQRRLLRQAHRAKAALSVAGARPAPAAALAGPPHQPHGVGPAAAPPTTREGGWAGRAPAARWAVASCCPAIRCGGRRQRRCACAPSAHTNVGSAQMWGVCRVEGLCGVFAHVPPSSCTDWTGQAGTSMLASSIFPSWLPPIDFPTHDSPKP